MAPKIHESNSTRFIPAKELYKHFIRIFRFCCLYFPQGSSKCNKVTYGIYFICFTIFIWSDILRQCSVIYRFGGTASLLVAVGMLLYSFGFAYSATSSCYSISVNLSPLLSNLDKHRTRFGEFAKIQQIRRLNIVSLLGYVIGLPTFSLIMTICVLLDNVWEGIKDMFYPFTTDTTTSAIITFSYFLLNVFFSLSVAYIQITLYVSISWIVYCEMDYLTERLMQIAKDNQERRTIVIDITDEDHFSKQTNAIDEDMTHISTLSKIPSSSLDRQLEELRLRYESVLDIITKANDNLQHLFFSVLVTSIPVSCLVLFGIISVTSNRPQIIYISLLNLNLFVVLFWILLLGTYTANKVKQPLEYAMKIDNGNLSAKSSSSLQLLCVRYLAPCLGFNVYGLLSLDSSTLLTVFGTLLTYAVVIYQFAHGSSCNCECYYNATNSNNIVS